MLRDYQLETYQSAQNEFAQGKRRVLVVAPCGSGKSYLFAEMTKSASKFGEVLILCHRIDLIQQHIELFKQLKIDTQNVRIESVFTEVNHLGEHKKPRLIILDEAHLSRANSWVKIIDYYDTFVIGFTATPCRLDGKPLGDIYDSLIDSVSVDWLIKNKMLADFDYFAPMTIDTDKINSRAGDYVTVELEQLMCDRKIYGDIIKNYRKYADNKKTIIYCVNIKHANETAKLFRDNGYSAASIDSTLDKSYRAETMQKFRNGEIKILCNCGIISEGISIDDCAVTMLLRPTQSLALYIQQSSRCLRYMPNKRATIIDCVGNYARHGLPNMQHEWNLSERIEPKRIYDDAGNYYIRICQNCFRPFKTARFCPNCGAEYITTEKEIKKANEIELEKITAAKLIEIEQQKKELRREVGRCRTLSELIRLGNERGYKNAYYWAEMILKGRNKK